MSHRHHPTDPAGRLLEGQTTPYELRDTDDCPVERDEAPAIITEGYQIPDGIRKARTTTRTGRSQAAAKGTEYFWVSDRGVISSAPGGLGHRVIDLMQPFPDRLDKFPAGYCHHEVIGLDVRGKQRTEVRVPVLRQPRAAGVVCATPAAA